MKGGHFVHQVRQPLHLKQIAASTRHFRPYGDPGFFGSLISGADKFITKAASFVPGGSIAVSGAGALVGLKQKIFGALKRHPKAVAIAGGTAAAGIGAAIEGMLGGHGKGKGRVSASGHRRYRRMNPLNYHALKRSARRIHQASKIMRTVFHQAKHVRMPKRAPRGVRPQRRRHAA